MDTREHWEQVYESKAPDEVSWYRPHLETSLAFIERAAPSRSAAILDVGGGASTLVDDLAARGYTDVTVLDVSQRALEIAQERLGAGARNVKWVAGDITKIALPEQAIDIWHDRAVFHFLTTAAQRAKYVQLLLTALKPGGHVILATFGTEGPSKCSGLDVIRYDANSLQREFGDRFRLIESSEELHHTPSGGTQQFLYCDLRFEKTMRSGESAPPLLDHSLNQPSAFTPEGLIENVRRARRTPMQAIPPVCFLEFDGDLTDWLVSKGIAQPFDAWPCFHTRMFALKLAGVDCGIVARTIGGPFAVLVAEQLHAAGAKLIAGLTSAGRVSAELPLPCLVIATSAIRDEGTSLHYLAPGKEVACPGTAPALIEQELAGIGWNVRSGKVWTTDAPYRETADQLRHWAKEGVLAVEMQAASLFAFATARSASVACAAIVSNAIDHAGEQFNTGSQEAALRILEGIARAARSLI